MRLLAPLFGLLAWPSLAFAAYNEPTSCPQLPALTGNVTTSAGGCATTIGSGVVTGAMMSSTVSLPAGGTAPSGFTLTDVIDQEYKNSTAEYDTGASNATLAVITGLALTLTAGKTYNCRGHISITSGSATAGAKVGLFASGGLTATSISRTVHAYAGTTLSVANTTTALDATSGGAGAAALITDAYIDAGIVVNAGGVLNVGGAQDVSTSGTTNQAKFLLNSTFACVRVN